MNETKNIKLPQHIGLILDGNGRWALRQGKERNYGHYVGAKNVFTIAKSVVKRGIKYLTVYALSLENWKRPKEEVGYLIELFRSSIDECVIRENNIRFKVLGDMTTLPTDLVLYLTRLEHETIDATGLVFTICISYSSKWEITKACKSLYEYVQKK